MEKEKLEICPDCGREAELQPVGINSKRICAACAIELLDRKTGNFMPDRLPIANRSLTYSQVVA